MSDECACYTAHDSKHPDDFIVVCWKHGLVGTRTTQHGADMLALRHYEAAS